MRSLTAVALTLLLFAPFVVSQEDHHHQLSEQELGSVHFATSCRADLAGSFNRAVAMLHSFQYEDARAAFSKIAEQDPDCAMAYWGVAMTHYHGLWENGDTAAGRTALNKAMAVAATNPKTTSRETSYIDALAEVYREDGKDSYAHGQAFEEKIAASSSPG